MSAPYAHKARVAQRLDWQDRASCAGMRTSEWFPLRRPGTPDQGPYKAHVEKLRAMCAACPVRRECARFALDETVIGAGVWAGVDLTTSTPAHNRRRLWAIAKGEA